MSDENKGKKMKKQTVKLSEDQLKHIVNCVVMSKKEQPQADKVVVAGEGWHYTFIIFLGEKSEDMPSLN